MVEILNTLGFQISTYQVEQKVQKFLDHKKDLISISNNHNIIKNNENL